MDYPVETFTDEERALLAPHFTNLDRPVFALVNLPETVKGALFARYSRYQGTLRRLYLEEFAADAVPGAGFDGEEGERARKLYERIFIGYGDDSVAQLGGAHIAVRVGLQRDDEAAPARPARGVPRAVHPLHGLRRPDGRGPRLPLLAPPGPGPGVRGSDGLTLQCLLRGAAPRRGMGRRALPAHRRRARGGAHALASAPRRSTCCAACCRPPRCRTWASSRRARRTSSCCCA